MCVFLYLQCLNLTKGPPSRPVRGPVAPPPPPEGARMYPRKQGGHPGSDHTPQSSRTCSLPISGFGWEPGRRRHQDLFLVVWQGVEFFFSPCVYSQNAQSSIKTSNLYAKHENTV